MDRNVSIEQCKQFVDGISWEGVASLVKAAHHNGGTKITQREIYLAYDLKYNKDIILINHTNFCFCKHIDVHVDFFPYMV